MPESRWYVARAKAGQAHLALTQLQRQNFVVYYPRITIERWRRGRISTESEPLFPGYLLVQFNLNGNFWRAINSTFGVMKLLSANPEGTPTPLPRGEIETLQKRETAGKLYVSEVSRIRRGDLVRVKIGLAADQIGKVVRTRGERVQLLLSLLGREVRVTTAGHVLEVVERTADLPLSAVAIAASRA